MIQVDNKIVPRVQDINGKLTLLDEKEAYQNAMRTGDYISFNNEQEALAASIYYKQGKYWNAYSDNMKK
jgi:hypothetical protein